MLEREDDAQLLTVAVSSNETSDKSASDLVLFPFAFSLPFQSVIQVYRLLHAGELSYCTSFWSAQKSLRLTSKEKK